MMPMGGVFDFDTNPSESLTQWWNEDVVLSVIRDGRSYTTSDIFEMIQTYLVGMGMYQYYALRTTQEVQKVLGDLVSDKRVLLCGDMFCIA
jgi:hypothetical protein